MLWHTWRSVLWSRLLLPVWSHANRLDGQAPSRLVGCLQAVPSAHSRQHQRAPSPLRPSFHCSSLLSFPTRLPTLKPSHPSVPPCFSVPGKSGEGTAREESTATCNIVCACYNVNTALWPGEAAWGNGFPFCSLIPNKITIKSLNGRVSVDIKVTEKCNTIACLGSGGMCARQGFTM